MKKIAGNGMGLDWRKVGFGVAVSALVMVVMTAFGAWLLGQEIVAMEWINYLAALVLLIASFVGGLTAGASMDSWLMPLLVGAGFWCFLMVLHVLGYEEALDGILETALVILGGSGASILLGRGGERRRNSRRKRRIR